MILGLTDWTVPGFQRQVDFYCEQAAEFRRKDQKVMVTISDALRYDVDIANCIKQCVSITLTTKGRTLAVGGLWKSMKISPMKQFPLFNESERGTAFLHRQLIGQILSNLIEDALKYADGADQISLCAADRKDHVFLSGADNGKSILSKRRAEAQKHFCGLNPLRKERKLGFRPSLVRALVKLHDRPFNLWDYQLGLQMESTALKYHFLASLWNELREQLIYHATPRPKLRGASFGLPLLCTRIEATWSNHIFLR